MEEHEPCEAFSPDIEIRPDFARFFDALASTLIYMTEQADERNITYDEMQVSGRWSIERIEELRKRVHFRYAMQRHYDGRPASQWGNLIESKILSVI